MFSCGCDPRYDVICETHCQWQGCAPGDHTGACVKGERLVACQYNREPHVLDDECVNIRDAGTFEVAT
jgi:hypothetical protein